MKIAFHNRQRLIKADMVKLGRIFERLLAIAGEELVADPPSWLRKRQLQRIFTQGQLSLVFVSNRSIRTINKQWREMDKATDVLSFPLELTPPPWLEKPVVSGIAADKKNAPPAKGHKKVRGAGEKNLDFDQDFRTDTDRGSGFGFDACAGDADADRTTWLVGELIISLERAQEQASDFGHSLEREIAFLFVHGVLHVFGFDHMNRADEKEMFGRQRRILERAGIKRK